MRGMSGRLLIRTPHVVSLQHNAHIRRSYVCKMKHKSGNLLVLETHFKNLKNQTYADTK
jgi:hypothetical protein